MDDAAHRRRILMAQGYERVYVENEYWDGPVSGVADVDGVPSYFQSAYFAGEDEADSGEFLIWPIARSTLEAEIEHYLIFAEWLCNGQVGPHPGSPPKNVRFGELDEILAPLRRVPRTHRRRVASWASFDDDRYRLDGPGYLVRWSQKSP
ncbi:hypothetical protein [Amycolatopsis sp. NPDC057786]|uniref:hypothetical protein n=1 Tax=Amycolatopsis sp. NPDC057786 TaxID=3346250 RepID=UPI00366B6D09